MVHPTGNAQKLVLTHNIIRGVVWSTTSLVSHKTNNNNNNFNHPILGSPAQQQHSQCLYTHFVYKTNAKDIIAAASAAEQHNTSERNIYIHHPNIDFVYEEYELKRHVDRVIGSL